MTRQSSLTVLGSLRALRWKEVPIALVPLPLPALPPEKGFPPSFSFCVPCRSHQQLSRGTQRKGRPALPSAPLSLAQL